MTVQDEDERLQLLLSIPKPGWSEQMTQWGEDNAGYCV